MSNVARGDLRIRDERRQLTRDPRVREHLDVEVGQRHDRADTVLLAQRAQRRDIRRVVDPRHRDADVGRVLRRRKRVRIRRHHQRMLRERRDDVVALPHARQQHGNVPAVGAWGAVAREQYAYALGGCHPPVSPL